MRSYVLYKAVLKRLFSGREGVLNFLFYRQIRQGLPGYNELCNKAVRFLFYFYFFFGGGRSGGAGRSSMRCFYL